MTKSKCSLITPGPLLGRYINLVKISADKLREKAETAVGVYGQTIDSWYHTPEISVRGV